ncbi:MAG: U32 family peptidase [Lachnospirales bacterium]
MRLYNGRIIELLAPAGNLEIFKEIVETNCDAILLGGVDFNMRRMRDGFNFTNDELQEVMKIAKIYNKKIYIALNVLIASEEVEELKDYLVFLDNLKPDAIMVQDFAIFEIIKSMRLKNLNIHSSIQMNIHEVESVKLLKELGVGKIVLSYECSAFEIREMYRKTNMDFEYFCYGEMCTVKNAQCGASSFIFGNNTGRGRCFKVCRWNYNLEHDGKLVEPFYPLGTKDLSIFPYIKELFECGITTFNIEGRMRDASFLVPVINTFGYAIDELIEQGSYSRSSFLLNDTRIRDLSVGYLKGDPKLNNVNVYNESHIKKFSTSAEISEIDEKTTEKIIESLNINDAPKTKNLSIYVSRIDALEVAINEGVSRVYISDEFENIMLDNIEKIDKKDTEIFFATPRTMSPARFQFVEDMIKSKMFDGLLYTTFGCTKKFKDYKVKLVAESNLLTYNHKAIKFITENLNTDEVTLSYELNQNELASLLKANDKDIEVIVHGVFPIMYTHRRLLDFFDPKDVESNKLVLKSDKTDFDVIEDRYSMSNILPQKEFCLQNVLGELQKFEHIKHFRIDGRFYDNDELKDIIQIYKNTIKANVLGDNYEKYETKRKGLTYGALNFGGNK